MCCMPCLGEVALRVKPPDLLRCLLQREGPVGEVGQGAVVHTGDLQIKNFFLLFRSSFILLWLFTVAAVPCS